MRARNPVLFGLSAAFGLMTASGVLWAATGVSYPELIERLIQLGIERHEEKKRNQYSR